VSCSSGAGRPEAPDGATKFFRPVNPGLTTWAMGMPPSGLSAVASERRYVFGNPQLAPEQNKLGDSRPRMGEPHLR
jgi:hypothetical protein